MHIKPCARCPKRKDCERRAAVVKGVRGLRLTSIAFQCDTYTDAYQPGMRVRAKLLTGRETFEATGTVMAWQGRKVQVCVDEEFQAPMETVYGWSGEPDIQQPEDTISKSVVKLWPDRLTPTGETVPICRNCRRPMHRPIEGWKCNRHDDTETCVAGDPEEYFREKCAAERAEWSAA
jgi:hypothetical protein